MKEVHARQLQIGDRLLIRGEHPWAGQIGKYVRDERTPYGESMVLELESNGIECMLTDFDKEGWSWVD